MTDQLSSDTAQIDLRLQPRIAVIGRGVTGGNAVNNMIEANFKGVEFRTGKITNLAMRAASKL